MGDDHSGLRGDGSAVCACRRPQTLAAIVRIESGFNPYAIGVVHGRLVKQPRHEDEAIATVQALQAAGWNYSAGLTQINRENWSRYGLTARTVFDVCRNLSAGAAILQACFMRKPRHSCRSTRGVARSAVVLCEREFRNRLSRRVCTADRGGRGVGRHDRPCAVVIGKADSSNTRPCDWIPG